MLPRAGRLTSTSTRPAEGRSALGVDVGVKVAAVEPQIFSEFHEGQAGLSVGADVLVDPRHTHLQKMRGLLNRQQIGDGAARVGRDFLCRVEISGGAGTFKKKTSKDWGTF